MAQEESQEIKELRGETRTCQCQPSLPVAFNQRGYSPVCLFSGLHAETGWQVPVQGL